MAVTALPRSFAVLDSEVESPAANVGALLSPAPLLGLGDRVVGDPGRGYVRRMSIPVPLERLRTALAERAPRAYLLTVTDDGRPHAVHVAVRWEGAALAADVGKGTAANAAARPAAVSLVFPVRAPDDYSLILDATAAVAGGGDGRRLLLAPTKAVLHRAAAVPDPAATCADDCVPLLPETGVKQS